MSLIEDVAKLKELAGRRLAIERAKDTPNHAVLERIEIERELLDTAPVLLGVLDFRDGDAMILGCFLEFMKFYNPDGHLDDRGDGAKITNRQAADCLRRMTGMARRMEAKQE